MLERLSGKLSDIVRQLGGKAHISEQNIRDAIPYPRVPGWAQF